MSATRATRNDERIRTFVAIEPSAPARESAVRVVAALRGREGGDGVRWIRPESLHVTLRFLGDIAVDEAPALGRRVAAEVASEPGFELFLGDVGRLPERGKARVVTLSLEPSEPVVRLAAAVERAVVSAGFEPEARPFRPHLTLGRVRRGSSAPALEPAPLVDAASFSVEDVVLFRSELSSAGARYHALERMPLGVSDHPTNPSLED